MVELCVSDHQNDATRIGEWISNKAVGAWNAWVGRDDAVVLLADRGYGSDNIRKTMEARHVVPVIRMRKSRKLRVAGDRSLYKLRNLVQRCFNRLKNARRVATRYDKTAESFLGFIDITSIRLWLRHLST